MFLSTFRIWSKRVSCVPLVQHNPPRRALKLVVAIASSADRTSLDHRQDGAARRSERLRHLGRRICLDTARLAGSATNEHARTRPPAGGQQWSHPAAHRRAYARRVRSQSLARSHLGGNTQPDCVCHARSVGPKTSRALLLRRRAFFQSSREVDGVQTSYCLQSARLNLPMGK